MVAKFALTKRESADHPAYNCPAEKLLELMAALRNDLGYDFLTDITAIDWHERQPRFSVVYHLYSTGRHEYMRIVSDCANNEKPAMPSLSALWAGANWLEREVFDMFGIAFTGHPNLKRILMWDEYPYHPLRKDFPLAGIETELPGADVAAETGAKVIASPMLGGPFVSPQGGPMSRREPRALDQAWSEEKEKP